MSVLETCMSLVTGADPFVVSPGGDRNAEFAAWCDRILSIIAPALPELAPPGTRIIPPWLTPNGTIEWQLPAPPVASSAEPAPTADSPAPTTTFAPTINVTLPAQSWTVQLPSPPTESGRKVVTATKDATGKVKIVTAFDAPCPECGADVDADDVTCPSCGAEVDGD